MTKYILISDAFDGNVSCYYNDVGYLVEFAVSSWNIKADDHTELLQNMGYLLSDNTLQEFCNKQGYKWKKTRIDLSFERFWVMYGYARHRIQAERNWAKLSEKERFYVIMNLKSYLRYCKRNPKYTRLLPDTYLNSNTKDNWDKVEDFKK